jgi:putative salt-induced outer membrane protein YdiY
MTKATLLLAGALMISPAMFAQQQSATPADQSSSATQSSQPSATPQAATQDSASTKSSLTADQKAELKTLRTKARSECKADKTSDACKQAKSDLHSKMSEYGVTAKHHGHKKAAASTQSPS